MREAMREVGVHGITSDNTLSIFEYFLARKHPLEHPGHLFRRAGRRVGLDVTAGPQ
jgi:hypothetical protein